MIERWSYCSINYRSKAVDIGLHTFLTSAVYTANIGTKKKIVCPYICHRTKLELKISCQFPYKKKVIMNSLFILNLNLRTECLSVIARLDQRVTLQCVCVITTPNGVASGNMTAIS